MKKYTVFTFLLCSQFVYSQYKEKANFIIYYNVTHLLDIDSINQKGNTVINYNMNLIVGNRISYCASENKISHDSIAKEEGNRLLNNMSNSNVINPEFGTKSSKRLSIEESTEIYKNFEKSEIDEIKTIVINRFLLKDSLNMINWEIVGLYKKINNFNCQKAICKFKGRIWEAWFCPDIPLSNGPWKLGGLPGLILEAIDSKKQINFQFGGITKDVNDKYIVFHDEIKKVTKSDFIKNVQFYANDPIGYSNNAFFGLNNNMDNISLSQFKTKKLKVANNPIELSEQ